MKLRELIPLLYDKVCVYTDNKKDDYINAPYIDLYKGESADIPLYLYDYEVRSIGSQRKGIIDICVKK